MSNTSRIQHKGQVTIPTPVRKQAGLAPGDLVEFAFKTGQIVITPKLIIDRSAFPSADKDYTPAQRRQIDARLKKSLAEVKKGKTAGPFETADQMISSIKQALKKRSGKNSKSRTR